ncbi:MAG: hypothetical protein Q7S52_05990, partial [bacterium]|nr:hypothetical protein [bacterium]
MIHYVLASDIPNDISGACVRFIYDGEEEVNKLPNGQKEIVLRFGKHGEMNRRKLITLVRKMVGRAKSARAKRVVLSLDDLYSKCSPKMAYDPADLAELVTVNIEMANYEFVAYKEKPKDGWPFIEEVVLVGTGDRFLDGMRRGKIIGDGVNFQRDLGNTPPSSMTPERLADEAHRATDGLPITLRVLDVPEMICLGMEGVVGVGA